MTTNQIGNLGELKALAKFAEYQIPIYIPYEDERCDFIAEFNGKLNKMQVKSSTILNERGALSFKLLSTSVTCSGVSTHAYNEKEIDYFILYSLITNELYILNISEAPLSQVQLRLIPPGNNQTKGIRMAEDFVLDSFLQNNGYRSIIKK